MANPQLEHGYTRIAHEILEALYAHELPSRELRVAIYLLRETYGWGRTEHAFSVRDLEAEVGLHWETARKTLGSLVAKGIVRVIAPANFEGPGRYAFQKDWQAWQAPKNGLIGAELQSRRQNAQSRVPVKNTPPDQKGGTPQSGWEGTPQNGWEGSPRKHTKQRPPIVDSMRDSARLKIVKDRSKDIPVAQESFPQSFPQGIPETGARAPEPPGTGRVNKKKIEEFPPGVLACLETLDAFLGPLNPDLRRRLGTRVLKAIGDHGEADVAIALRESIRETIFKSDNDPKPPEYPASMAVKHLARHLGPLRAHNKRIITEIRKRGVEGGLRKIGPFRWVMPSGWRTPARVKDDPLLKTSPLAAYISSHAAEWIAELARQAGASEGGAGPGPSSRTIDLGAIGRDLNSLED